MEISCQLELQFKLLKRSANETLERTTGEHDSGLEPEDTNSSFMSSHFYRKQ